MTTLRPHLLIATWALVFCLAEVAAAECAPRPQDAIWFVDTRGAGCFDASSGEAPKLKVSRYDNGRWVRSSLAEFLASDDPSVHTTFWLHGNQIDVPAARDMGLSVYEELIAVSPDPAPQRMVIFSWPSEKIRGILKDVRTKASRSDAAGYHLAWLLDQMNPAVKTTLIGYSFGARSVGGAMHMLGGGRVAGFELPSRDRSARARSTVVFMAAAMDVEWLLPGERMERAMPQTERLLLVNNCCDWVLKRYRLLYCGGCAVALGHAGLDVSALPEAERVKVRQFDACCYVGKKHDWTRYVYSSGLMSRVRPYVFIEGAHLAARDADDADQTVAVDDRDEQPAEAL